MADPILSWTCDECGANNLTPGVRMGAEPRSARCEKCGNNQVIHEPVHTRPDDPEETHLRRPPREDTTKRRIQTVRPLRPGLHLQPGRLFYLTIVSGPDEGRVFPIDRPRVVIGRSGADIHLADKETSRNHAALEFEGESATLIDLQSTNGTFVNGRPVESARIGNYGEFQIGSTTLLLTVTDALSPS